MKTLLSTLVILLCSSIAVAQTDYTAEAKKELVPLFEKFTEKQKEVTKEQEVLEKMSKSLDTAITTQATKTRRLKAELDSLYIQHETAKKFYSYRKVPIDSLNKYFEVQEDYTMLNQKEQSTEKAIYLLYGDNKIVKELVFKKDKEIEDIFKNIIADSETCLGSFEIPGNRQKIRVWSDIPSSKEKQKKIKKKNENQEKNKKEEKQNNLDTITTKFVYFESVKFSLRGGCVNDIRVEVSDESGKFRYYFENLVPVSLLNYTTASSNSYLRKSTSTQMDIDAPTNDEFDNYVMMISDALSYLPNPGNNFVPDDEEFTFPKEEATDKSEPKRREYKIIQKTNLQNVIELRAYTDFLGLFDDAENGIVQFEGKADFFMSPFQRIFKTFPFTVFKKVSPYVHFTKLDETFRSLTLTPTIADPNIYTINQPLEIIEKSYLDMGFILDIASMSFTKNYPFNMNLYWALRYQVATIELEEVEDENFKTVGNGVGLRFEFKRFNNFGLCLSPEVTYYNHLNRIDNIENPPNFWVFRNEAEVYYYPGTTKSQSVFLRLRTFLDLNDSEDSFFQLQFGYRFTIGLGSVKAKS